MSNYDTWKQTDTAGNEQAGWAQAEVECDEDLRAERWATFVAWCKGDRVKTDSEWSTLVLYVYQNMRDQGDWHHDVINCTILDFAESEGWDGVLSALSRAMREQRAA